MPKFEDVMRRATEQRPEPNFDASVDCMWCGEEVDGAFHDPIKGILVYWCSKDHKSVLENFNI